MLLWPAIQAQTAEQPAPSRGRLTWRAPVLFGDCRGAEPFERSACPSLPPRPAPPRLPAPPPKTNTQTCPPIQILVGRSNSAVLAVPAPSSSPDSASRRRPVWSWPGPVRKARARTRCGRFTTAWNQRETCGWSSQPLRYSVFKVAHHKVKCIYNTYVTLLWLFICFVWCTLRQSNCIANKYAK